METNVTYAGRDLEAMSFAVNYHRWILQIFSPHLGERVVEVGAGSGSFSELLLELPLASLTLLEPSKGMYQLLDAWTGQSQTSIKLLKYNTIFKAAAEEIRDQIRPDSIIYVNVMEHIDDDVGEMKVAYETLAPGGRLFIFVPALRWLYGSYDEQIGHFRRYTRHELSTKVRLAGFQVVRVGYFDFTGIVPWWVKYRVLNSDKMEPYAVRLYDKAVVPFIKRVEAVIPPPLGKNLFLIAEKS